jgi:hypothetical protein
MQKQPGPFQMTFLDCAVFRDHRKPAARIVSNPADSTPATTKAPIAFDPAQSP